MTAPDGHGQPIPCPEEIALIPHAGAARMALEILWGELLNRVPSGLDPREKAVKDALSAMHQMLWDKEMQAVAETGITPHYLVIRPLNPLNLPGPGQVAEIRDAMAVLVRHDMIARGSGDG
jgi:hypothetical protein